VSRVLADDGILLVVGLEFFLAYAANGADPVVGNILEGGARCDAAVGITLGGIVDITTRDT
jgi:hypothetical protein